jgi:hypothetical protein
MTTRVNDPQLKATILNETMATVAISGGQGVPGADSGMTFASISNAQAAPAPAHGTQAIMRGRTAEGDTGGGVFYWDAGSSVAPDGGTIFQRGAGGVGRWKRLYDGHLQAAWWGVVPVAGFDNKPNLQTMFSQFAHAAGWPSIGSPAVPIFYTDGHGAVIEFADGVYQWDNEVFVPYTVSLVGHHRRAVVFQRMSSAAIWRHGDGWLDWTARGRTEADTRGYAGTHVGIVWDGNLMAGDMCFVGAQYSPHFDECSWTHNGGRGLIFEGTTNPVLDQPEINNNRGGGLFIDKGVNGLDVLVPAIWWNGHDGGYNLEIGANVDPHSAGIYSYYCRFFGGRVENLPTVALSGGGPGGTGLFKAGAGLDIEFFGTAFTDNGQDHPTTLIDINKPATGATNRFRWHSCQVAGTAGQATFFKGRSAAGGDIDVEFSGLTHLRGGFVTGWDISAGYKIRIGDTTGDIYTLATTPFTSPDGATRAVNLFERFREKLIAEQGIQIGSAAAQQAFVPVILTRTFSWDPASVVTGSSVNTGPISFTGAQMGDHVFLTFDALTDANGWQLWAYVSAAGTVRGRLTNNTGATVDLPSGTARMTILRAV